MTTLQEWVARIEAAEAAARAAQQAADDVRDMAASDLSPLKIGDRVLRQRAQGEQGEFDEFEITRISLFLWNSDRPPSFDYRGARVKRNGTLSATEVTLYERDLLRKDELVPASPV